LHHQAGAEQPGLYDSLADPQRCRSFGNTEILDIAQDQHFAVDFWQALNRALQ
jgi:hypothetical protein